ncbi:glycosyl transferase family protein [Ketogulonicigenium robustum]|uniref:Glycosyl transferase family protein n=1 Tax=Ketogulonicigenium robustum TaxID=92947 RepID=A0A1W6P0W5_9RHOB|nr:glycosyltransferase [Ketogulonicigenium robustum]ARO15152.1 glycosyl transferase family protein [Ketogulonicigenium robustum]
MTAPPPLISILIPAYNLGPHILAGLTALGPIPPQAEVLIYDDASGDDTAALAERWASQTPQARVLRGAVNGGVSHARNQLLTAARGGYVWFIDGDDTLAAGALQTVVDVLRAQHPNVLIVDFTRSGPTGENHGKAFYGPERMLSYDKAQLLAGTLRAQSMHLWARIYRRCLNAPHAFPEGKIYEDMAVLPQILASATSFYYLPEALITYRHRPDSLVTQVTPALLVDQFTALARLWDGPATRGWTPPDRVLLEYQIFLDRTLRRVLKHLLRCPVGDDSRAAYAQIMAAYANATTPMARRRAWVELWRGNLNEVRRGARTRRKAARVFS